MTLRKHLVLTALVSCVGILACAREDLLGPRFGQKVLNLMQVNVDCCFGADLITPGGTVNWVDKGQSVVVENLELGRDTAEVVFSQWIQYAEPVETLPVIVEMHGEIGPDNPKQTALRIISVSGAVNAWAAHLAECNPVSHLCYIIKDAPITPEVKDSTRDNTYTTRFTFPGGRSIYAELMLIVRYVPMQLNTKTKIASPGTRLNVNNAGNWNGETDLPKLDVDITIQPMPTIINQARGPTAAIAWAKDMRPAVVPDWTLKGLRAKY